MGFGTPPQFHEKTPREGKKTREDARRERKKEEKRMNMGAREGKKKREILGPPPFGPPTLRAPSLRAPSLRLPTLLAPTFFLGLGPHRFESPPFRVPTLGPHPSGPHPFSGFGPTFVFFLKENGIKSVTDQCTNLNTKTGQPNRSSRKTSCSQGMFTPVLGCCSTSSTKQPWPCFGLGQAPQELCSLS